MSYLGNIYNSFKSGDNYMSADKSATITESTNKQSEEFTDIPSVYMLIGLILLVLIVLFIIGRMFLSSNYGKKTAGKLLPGLTKSTK